MRDLKVTFLIVLMLLLSVGSLFSTNVSSILDLWNIRNDLGGTYTLTEALNLEKTNPGTISEWASNSYSEGDIVEYTDGYAYYSNNGSNSNEPTGATDTNWTKMWEVAKGWDPIGDGTTPFHGNFDGGGNIISNLYIDRGADDPADTSTLPPNGENFVGLFGYVTNGSTTTNASNNNDIYIQNVALTNVTITGKRGTGALIGKVDLPDVNNGKLVITENCYVSGGTVTGFGATGGLVGANNSQRKQVVPIIRFCYADVAVSSTHPLNTTPSLTDETLTAGVFNPFNIKYGGLVGCNENGLTQDSYALGNVSGGDRVGGLAGCSIGGAIFRSYATGSVTQGIGSISWEGGYGPITGRVAGNLPPGLGGTNETGSLEDSYYLSSASVSGIYPTTPNDYGTAQSDSDLTNATSYTNWDPAVWNFTTGYPTLQSSPSSIFYFRTKATGNFSTASNWEKSDTESGTYSQSVIKPDYTNSVSIKVLSGHTITLQDNNDAFISATTVEGTLVVATGATLNVENKAGDDLIVSGDLEVTGTLNIGQSATVIGNTNSTITFNGTSAQSVPSGITSVYNLTIDNNSGVTLPDNIAINGLLTITSGNYNVPTSIVVDGLDSPSVKHLAWPKTDFNIVNYSASTTASSSFPTYINRKWNISGNIVEATEANRVKEITFYWDTSEDNNYDWINLGSTPVLFDGGVEVGEATATSLNGDTRSATFDYTFPESAKSSKGDLTIGLGNDQTLPVQLSTFDAFNQSSNNVMIQWVTQSESDLDGYRLYRNIEKSLVTAIMLDTFIPGTNTSQTQTYSYIDNTLEANGIYYYWIQMIDYDGSNSFYGPAIVEVDNDFHETVDIPLVTGFVSVYPNPFNPTTTIRYALEVNSPVTIDIYNIKGQLVKTFDFGLQAQGFHQVVWQGDNNTGNALPSGIYFSKMKTQDKVDIKKVMLLK